ncbi:MAG: PLP-dependent aminotransferase family protein [Rhodospirillales bacterium]|nr:PLP-dependent aminotransferase family protein [Rhodospirillales bacterium]
MWIPDIDGANGPKYAAIADSIADAVARGDLKQGDRLPPHRDLAYRLGVTVGTVTRAFKEAERRGLIGGEVGRGTFVRERPRIWPFTSFALCGIPREAGVIDLSLAYPVAGNREQLAAEFFSQLAQESGWDPLLDYQMAEGSIRHREAGSRWLSISGLDAPVERVVVTAGCQHGITASLAAVCRAGDLVLAEELTFPGIQSAARMLGINLRPVPMDAAGILPDALDEACVKNKVRAVYTIPTYQNPTTAVMDPERRRAIAAVAERHAIYIVEDDVYGTPHGNHPPPIATFAPDWTFYLTSASKVMAPGLRIGFALTPSSGTRGFTDAVRTMSWMAGPAMAELVTRWIDDGTTEVLTNWHQQEARARAAIATRWLGRNLRTASGSYHSWLTIPPEFSPGDVIAEAGRQGVKLIPSDSFAIGNTPVPPNLRLCLGAAQTRDDVETAARVIADILSETRPLYSAVV